MADERAQSFASRSASASAAGAAPETERHSAIERCLASASMAARWRHRLSLKAVSLNPPFSIPASVSLDVIQAASNLKIAVQADRDWVASSRLSSSSEGRGLDLSGVSFTEGKPTKNKKGAQNGKSRKTTTKVAVGAKKTSSSNAPLLLSSNGLKICQRRLFCWVKDLDMWELERVLVPESKTLEKQFDCEVQMLRLFWEDEEFVDMLAPGCPRWQGFNLLRETVTSACSKQRSLLFLWIHSGTSVIQQLADLTFGGQWRKAVVIVNCDANGALLDREGGALGTTVSSQSNEAQKQTEKNESKKEPLQNQGIEERRNRAAVDLLEEHDMLRAFPYRITLRGGLKYRNLSNHIQSLLKDVYVFKSEQDGEKQWSTQQLDAPSRSEKQLGIKGEARRRKRLPKRHNTATTVAFLNPADPFASSIKDLYKYCLNDFDLQSKGIVVELFRMFFAAPSGLPCRVWIVASIARFVDLFGGSFDCKEAVPSPSWVSFSFSSQNSSTSPSHKSKSSESSTLQSESSLPCPFPFQPSQSDSCSSSSQSSLVSIALNRGIHQGSIPRVVADALEMVVSFCLEMGYLTPVPRPPRKRRQETPERQSQQKKGEGQKEQKKSKKKGAKQKRAEDKTPPSEEGKRSPTAEEVMMEEIMQDSHAYLRLAHPAFARAAQELSWNITSGSRRAYRSLLAEVMDAVPPEIVTPNHVRDLAWLFFQSHDAKRLASLLLQKPVVDAFFYGDFHTPPSDADRTEAKRKMQEGGQLSPSHTKNYVRPKTCAELLELIAYICEDDSVYPSFMRDFLDLGRESPKEQDLTTMQERERLVAGDDHCRVSLPTRLYFKLRGNFDLSGGDRRFEAVLAKAPEMFLQFCMDAIHTSLMPPLMRKHSQIGASKGLQGKASEGMVSLASSDKDTLAQTKESASGANDPRNNTQAQQVSGSLSSSLSAFTSPGLTTFSALSSVSFTQNAVLKLMSGSTMSPSEVSDVLNRLKSAFSRYQRAEYGAACSDFLAVCLAIDKNNEGGNSMILGELLMNAAACETKLKRWKKATELHEHATKIFHRCGLPDGIKARLIASSLSELARISFLSGADMQALRLAQRSLTLYRSNGPVKAAHLCRYIMTLSYYATLSSKIGDQCLLPTNVRAYLEYGLTWVESMQNQVQKLEDKAKDSKDSDKEGKQAQKTSKGETAGTETKAEEDKQQVEEITGEWEAQEEAAAAAQLPEGAAPQSTPGSAGFTERVAGLQRAMEGMNYELARVFHLYGASTQLLGNSSEACWAFEKSIALLRRCSDESLGPLADSLRCMGENLGFLNRPSEATQTLTESLAVNIRARSVKDPTVMLTLFSLGENQNVKGEVDEANSTWKKLRRLIEVNIKEGRTKAVVEAAARFLFLYEGRPPRVEKNGDFDDLMAYCMTYLPTTLEYSANSAGKESANMLPPGLETEAQSSLQSPSVLSQAVYTQAAMTAVKDAKTAEDFLIRLLSLCEESLGTKGFHKTDGLSVLRRIVESSQT